MYWNHSQWTAGTLVCISLLTLAIYYAYVHADPKYNDRHHYHHYKHEDYDGEFYKYLPKDNSIYPASGRFSYDKFYKFTHAIPFQSGVNQEPAIYQYEENQTLSNHINDMILPNLSSKKAINGADNYSLRGKDVIYKIYPDNDEIEYVLPSYRKETLGQDRPKQKDYESFFETSGKIKKIKPQWYSI